MFGIIESQFAEFAEFSGVVDEKHRDFSKQDFIDMKDNLEIIDEKAKKCEEVLDDVRVHLGRIMDKDDQFNNAKKQLNRLDKYQALIKNKQSTCHSAYISEKETQEKLKELMKGTEGFQKEHMKITGQIDSDGQKLINVTRALNNANVNVNHTGQALKNQEQNQQGVECDIQEIQEHLQKSEGIQANAKRRKMLRKLIIFGMIALFAVIDIIVLLYKLS